MSNPIWVGILQQLTVISGDAKALLLAAALATIIYVTAAFRTWTR